MASRSDYQTGRRAGLSRNAMPPPLLKTVNGKARFEPKNIDDPPMDDTESELSEPEAPSLSQPRLSANLQGSRSDQMLMKPSLLSKHAENRPQSNSKPATDYSDSDESPRPSRADIQRTPYYGTSKRGQEQARQYSASQERNSDPKRTVSSQKSETMARPIKRNSPIDAASHPISNKKRALTSRLDEAREVRKLRGEPKSYSQKDKNASQRPRNVSEKPTIRSSRGKTAANRKGENRSTPPKKPLPSFKAYDDDPFDQFPGKASLKGPMKLPSWPSSPPGSPPKASFLKHSSLSPGVSPRRPIKAEFKHPSGSLPEPLQSPERKSTDLLRDPELSPKPLCKGKEEHDSFFDLSDLSDQSSSDVDRETRCPMCGDAVAKALLDSFSGGSRLHIRKQIQFCRLHKKKSAEDAWDARGYPSINWECLGPRLTTHHDFLRCIINGGSSHYASLLVDKVKEGKNRTLLKAEDSLTPGYYGPRGLRAFSENIIGKFSSMLRERAVEDRLISSRGYSSYVEAVLVPELAVQLISEDMGVEADEARKILEESRWIGDLLHEDTGDTVDHLSGDERA
ncbi:hypothetical protein CH063_01892 [Colletotrichum higginsianum]|uniref:Restriction of telomere capping protein 4 n=1 Tax=Colletotrichum higginsianum (strain IMI 349063) TaxID=759273 RepID=H1VDP7_COLHI|nr:hypothetical protein CH63R_00458 [Colletotrichum higginsianum IMI 349063]OBR15278.1 hypothetical protein CH63R_00458 [Colletotrichum higginsianum IMI 349063]CCF38350.1 hypothetical protein CH063_01892 [Colletotrichum higginsianum]